ncbi:PD40 domain-containing protein [Cellulophaga sp. L1A9]|uniref:PD40 domain-containing protein n=1 Tax=Cellulophaga sp. L1A9 TaxID=2686362 RepID=UPI00131BD547|nr:PD40 domain-containing protein [Cellulophaga sp. L1A9]
MMNNGLFILSLFITSALFAQTEAAITPFDAVLNQFTNVRDFCISKDGQEAFFTVQSPSQELSQLAYIKKEKKGWSAPELLPFNAAYKYLEPFLSYDNNKLFFVSDRPLENTTNEKKDFDIWYVDRKNNTAEWSSPKNLGAPVNSTLDEFYPSVSKNNNLYFTMVAPEGLGEDDLYLCTWKNGKYSKPVLLNENINSAGYEFNAFIAEEEDFIIFSRYNEADGQGSGDLYLAKKDRNGVWQKAKNLGIPINTIYMDYCPFYDAQHQQLYFTSKRNTLTPREFESMAAFKTYLEDSKNGLSKIYQVHLNID